MIENPLPSHESWSWFGPRFRLDKALKCVYPHIPQRVIRLWLTRGGVTLNHKQVQAHTRLQTRDLIQIIDNIPLHSLYPKPNDTLSIPVLFENQDILLLHKPHGLPVHPLTPWETDTVVQGVLGDYPELLGVGEDRAPGLLHRLDNETSGVLAFARNTSSFTHLKELLHQGKWQKEYLCWVWGDVKEAITIREPIVHRSKQKMGVKKETKASQGEPQQAITHLQPLPSVGTPQVTPLWVTIETGVRHQIRVHLQSQGHPIVGDHLYSKKQEIPSFLGEDRLYLHAWRLTLPSQREKKDIVTIAEPSFPFPEFEGK